MSEQDQSAVIAVLMAVDGYSGRFIPKDGLPRYDLYAKAILSAPLPQDVIDLVIAGREAFPDMPDCDTKTALDDALEAFASRVPWENEPDQDPPQ